MASSASVESRQCRENASRGLCVVSSRSTGFYLEIFRFQSLKWREKWGVDDVESWEAPAVFDKHIPYGHLGFDKDGSPVILIPFAGIDIWGIMHSASKRDIIKNTIKLLEGEEVESVKRD